MEQVKTVKKQIKQNNINRETPKEKNRWGYECTKRVFDFVSSLIASIILIIPCIIIAIVIFIVDPGNPFFVQERVGKNMKPIKMVKFRSMVKNAENLERILSPEEYEQYLKEFKLDNDPRLLPHNLGNMIRKLSLDELPQIIFNICIKGDMSVIGPRPILPQELEMNYTSEEQKLLTSVKPGLTGYWQAYARNNAGYEDGERQKMELYYIHNRGIRLDIKILFQSVIAVIKRDGAC
ncbi:MAG: sugar transferase [Candidatus Ornithomonoglobus sp.]